MEKKPRRFISDEIAVLAQKNRFPTMATYEPKDTLTRKKDVACLTFKAQKPSFVDDAMYRGKTSPAFHRVDHKLVENRVIAPKYSKIGSHELKGPSYLQPPAATKNVSPHSYRAEDAFKMTSQV